MRILRVITSVNPAEGGPIENLTQVSRAFAEAGHQTEIVSLDAPDAPWVADCPFPVHAQGPGRGGYAYSPRFAPWLRAHHQDYDVVIVNGIWQYGSFATRRVLHGTETPYFVFTHGMLDPWFKRAYPLKHLKKCLYWPWGEYRVLRDARGVCFTCEEERVLASQSFWPYRVREIVVNYGTACPPDEPDAQREVFFRCFPALRHKRVVLFLSRIHPKKGCDMLIDAFAKVAEQDASLHLVIAGPDQTGWKSQLETQAAQRGIADRITWPGMLRDELKWGAFRAAEVFVLPSHQENFGIVVAEALACGVPVLISDKVNIWREIEADGAGFVAEDTAEGTHELLQRWLATPLERRQEMQRSARVCFTRRFEIQQAMQSLLDGLHFGMNTVAERVKSSAT